MLSSYQTIPQYGPFRHAWPIFSHLNRSQAVYQQIAGLNVAMEAPLTLEVHQARDNLERYVCQNSLGDGSHLVCGNEAATRKGFETLGVGPFSDE